MKKNENIEYGASANVFWRAGGKRVGVTANMKSISENNVNISQYHRRNSINESQ